MSFFQNYQILIVDDLPDNLLLLKTFLESEGYQIDTTTKSEAALAKIRAAPPHLVLLDVMMPDMNGFELTQLIRQDARLASMPIMLITADRGVDLNRANAVGANDVIYKPVDLEALLSRVKVWHASTIAQTEECHSADSSID